MLDISQVDAKLILTLDDVRRRNPISAALVAKMLRELDRVVVDKSVGAIIITGAGGNFSAGGDFGDMNERDLAGWHDHFEGLMRFVRRIISYPKPVIAAVEGWAVGAGLSLACCCDRIVAAQDARFLYGFEKVGLLPDLGLIHTLPLRIGVPKARQMMIWGEELDATEAKAIGLVDQIVAKGEALTQALQQADRALQAAPLPVAYLKPFLAHDLDRAIAFEIANASALFSTADHAEGKAAFFERRAPVFTGM